MSQLEANLNQLEDNLRQLEANLSQLEASWSQHKDQTCCWGTQIGPDLLLGYPAVGQYPWCGVFGRREVPLSERCDVFGQSRANNLRLLRTVRPCPDDDVILTNSLADADEGFAIAPMTLAELDKLLDSKPFRLTRRFVITQAMGKKRVIDDAAGGGQSDTSTDENVLQFCSVLQPACQLAQLARELQRRDMEWPKGETIVTAGEDWPNAYRYTPIRPEHALGCVWLYSGTRRFRSPCFRFIMVRRLVCLMPSLASIGGVA